MNALIMANDIKDSVNLREKTLAGTLPTILLPCQFFSLYSVQHIYRATYEACHCVVHCSSYWGIPLCSLY